MYKRSSQNKSDRASSLFFGLMGTPFQSDLVTSLFRMSEAALQQQLQVSIWTCGYGTTLTQSTLERPVDNIVKARAGESTPQTTAGLVQALFHKYPNNLRWYVCQYCMHERGAICQIPEVEVQLPYSFNVHLHLADRALVLGVKS